MNVHLFRIAFVLTLISSHFVGGQSINRGEYRGTFVAVKRLLDYGEVEGSPYLNEKLIGGIIQFNNGDTLNRYLRYDMYSDEMEYYENGQLLTLLKPQLKNLEYIILEEDTIVYQDFYIKQNPHSGYLLQRINDELSLFKRVRVEFRDAIPAKTSMHEPTPAKFVVKGDQWFYSIDNKPITLFKTDKAGIQEICGRYYEKVMVFAKKKKLKIRKEEDLIELLRYYSSLLDNT